MADILDLDREALKSGLADGSLMLVDVREPHEFEAGHIPGSVSAPLSMLDADALDELVSAAGERRVVFSCAAGIRSRVAIDRAQALGLDWREHYAGGFKDWLVSGEPVA